MGLRAWLSRLGPSFKLRSLWPVAGAMSRSPPVRWQCHALVDFDGTIAPDDPTDRLLERFADPAWRSIEAAWQAGRISSRACMQRQVALLRATPQELDAAIQTIQVDPAFPGFVSFCRRRRVHLTIVSDGFDRVVRTVLESAGLSVRFFANGLEWQGGDRWRLALPHARSDCSSQGANCKCGHRVRRDGPCVVVGDGRSDFCMSAQADYVIAKGALAGFCRSRGLPHAPFVNFADVTDRLAEWLEVRGGAPQAAPLSPLGGEGPAPAHLGSAHILSGGR
jgi:2-hydroxy-3-keto-5-methylthiopentenyl-1-phosphate phosphatase